MINKGSDKNVANIEVIEDFILELKSFGLNKDTLEVANELENLLAEREQMLKAINTVEKEKGEWIEECEQKDKRIKELEEENKRKDMFVEMAKEVIENSILKQVVIDVLQNNRNELFSMTYLSKEQYRPYEMQIERINKIEQELIGEDK